MNEVTLANVLFAVVVIWLATLAAFVVLAIKQMQLIERLWKWEAPDDDDDDDEDEEFPEPDEPPRRGKAKEFTLHE